MDSSAPEIAGNGAGGATAVWIRSIGSQKYRVQARSISTAGVLGPTRTLSKSVTSQGPKISSDEAGNAIAVWDRSIDFRHRIEARSISAAGVVGPTTIVSGTGPSLASARSPQIAGKPAGGGIVAWTQTLSGGKDRAQARSISAADVLGPTLDLSAVGDSASAFGPRIAVNAAGNAVASWTRVGLNIQARSISAAGTLGPIQDLSPAVGTPNTGVAIDADGDALVVSEQRAQTLSAAGVVGPVQNLGSTVDKLAVTLDDAGNAIAVMRGHAQGRFRIRASLGP